jgi:hypothetical protein
MSVQVEPISGGDIPAVATFLHTNLNSRVSAASWATALDVPWPARQPNHGFLLRGEGEVLGVLLAFYSERDINGRLERVCNLGAWCVRPDARFQSVRLLKAALAQDGWHFTDLSPSGAVVPLNARLGFQSLDTSTRLLPCLPRVPLLGRTRVVADPRRVRALLSARDRRVYDDHRGAAAAYHVVLQRPEGMSYVIYRRDRRKNLPLFASVLYASDTTVFERGATALGAHLLRAHGVLALLVESRVAGEPSRSISLSRSRPKMFRSPTLTADQVDNLYSELCCVPW